MTAIRSPGERARIGFARMLGESVTVALTLMLILLHEPRMTMRAGLSRKRVGELNHNIVYLRPLAAFQLKIEGGMVVKCEYLAGVGEKS